MEIMGKRGSGTGESDQIAATGGPRALVFDDHADIGALTVIRLSRLGFNAKAVVEESDFFERLEEWRPDLILLDLSLGGTDAIEIFSSLSVLGFCGHVILMSGHSNSVLDHARRLGELSGIAIAGVLKKPFLQRDLVALVAGLGEKAPRPRWREPSQTTPTLLRNLMDNNWLEFWYQPKVELGAGRVVGAESLARVRHPDRGVLPPSTFLEHASDDELYDLTARALDDALRCAGAMQQRNRSLVFSINVAARTLARDGLIEDFRAICARHSTSLPVILEVTETDLVHDKVAIQSFATRAILCGFRISIDDFGHGYASFERLRDLPFTELKLERSMVNGCARDPALRSICKAAVELAHAFGAMAIAEGVESEDDLNTVRSLGFDLAQGYFFSRPLPFQDFEQLPVAFPKLAAHGSDALIHLSKPSRRAGQ
jgi:EAL domain-containing protein (putative c-di-GMP-specific phosphodiesterase class I)/FixJ family two-component response regulator